MKLRYLGALLLALSMLCACARIDGTYEGMGTPPVAGQPLRTGLDVLVVLRGIVNSRALSSDDFYSEAELTRRFGRQLEVTISPGWASFNKGFAELVDEPGRSQSSYDGVDATMYKRMEQSGPNAGTLKCSVDVFFTGFKADMDFESVVARLGPEWLRNTEAERQSELAYYREPWNPARSRVTASMGRAIIDYGNRSGDSHTRLFFNPDGILDLAFISRFPC